MTLKYLLGIDPSFSKGLAFAISDWSTGEFIELKTFTDFWAGMDWLDQQLKEKGEFMVAVLEMPSENSTTFGMWFMFLNFLNKPRSIAPIQLLQSKFSIAMKRAQDVGKSKASGILIKKKLERNGINIICLAPSKRKKAYREEKKVGGGKTKIRFTGIDLLSLPHPTKCTAAQIKELFPNQTIPRTSEHCRDAMTCIRGWKIKSLIAAIKMQRHKDAK